MFPPKPRFRNPPTVAKYLHLQYSCSKGGNAWGPLRKRFESLDTRLPPGPGRRQKGGGGRFVPAPQVRPLPPRGGHPRHPGIRREGALAGVFRRLPEMQGDGGGTMNLLAALLAALLVFSPFSRVAQGADLRVLTSFLPMYLFTRNVGGDAPGVTVEMMLPASLGVR